MKDRAVAFGVVDKDLELAARNIGASPLKTFFSVTLPLVAPGILASGIFASPRASFVTGRTLIVDGGRQFL